MKHQKPYAAFTSLFLLAAVPAFSQEGPSQEAEAVTVQTEKTPASPAHESDGTDYGSSYYLRVIQQPYDPEEAEELIRDAKEAFGALPEKDQKDYLKHLAEASRYLNQKRIIEALDEIFKAKKIYKQDLNLFNLEGSCYSELRNFQSAAEAFEKALKLNPYNKGVRFNLAEMEFVTHDWKNSELAFEKLAPLMREDKNQSLIPIVEFKLLISKVKLGKHGEAQQLAARYTDMDDNPFHYYAKAVFALEKGKDAEASRWQAVAQRVYGKTASFAIWNDALIESGYVLSYYGGLIDTGEGSED